MKKTAVFSLALLVSLVPVSAATLEVEVIDARDFMVVFDMNDDMQVVGDNQINSQVTAVVWEPLIGATILPGADGMSQAGAVNSFGDVVGWFQSAATGEDTAVVWYADGGYQEYAELGTPSEVHEYTQGYAINDDGLVALMAGRVALHQPGEAPVGLSEDPYLWSASRGFTAMERLSGGDVAIRDMNSSGDVVGNSVGFDETTPAVMWNKNGKISVLGTPEGKDSAVARAISDTGIVVGHDEAFNSDSWVWTKKDGFTKLQDYGFMDKAVDVNRHGVIVGTADRYPWSPVPVVWDADGNVYDVQELMWEHNYYATDGITINDSNEMVIYAINFMTGKRQAVVLALTFVE